MDAYNRGYNASIELSGSSIRSASIVTDSLILGATNVSGQDERNDSLIGFYALAYDYNDGQIISIRGTDDPINGIWDLLQAADVWNGWTVSTGTTDSKQAAMEIMVRIALQKSRHQKKLNA